MKLISNPTECGWRKQTFTRLGLPSGIYTCWHKSKVAGGLICNKPIDFPKDCPLKDGILVEDVFGLVAKSRIHSKENLEEALLGTGAIDEETIKRLKNKKFGNLKHNQK